MVSLRYKATKLITSQLFWLQVCAVGIWVIAIQGFIHKDSKAQKVYVVGGSIDADVTGSVNVDNTVDVSGSVSVDNTVDINIESVNGYSNAFYGPNADGTYDALHVYTGK